MAVIRFELDLSDLDNVAYGLGGPSGPAFILDTSLLDGTDVLDGSPFLVTATASASLGGLSASASGTVTKLAVLSAPLGGISASASATVTEFAVFTATLDGMTASATAVVTPGGAPEPTPSGGRRVYSTTPRKKIEPLPIVEIPVVQPKRYRSAIASTMLGGMTCTATSSITFSILDDDAEVLLLV